MDPILTDSISNKCKSRKEYQAQITSLKKQAKSNKKNKKELLLEIAKLEQQFSEAFSEETTQLTNNADTTNNESSCAANQRISKAQKRRQKKLLDERERNQRIEEQEELNKQGARHVETLAIKTLLKSRGLCIFEVPSNGDCLYKAIEHQLLINDIEPITAVELRSRTGQYLRKNMEEFIPFMSNLETGDLLTDSEYENYCIKVESTNAWGGQIELKALASILRSTIEIIQAEGPPTIQGDEYKTKPLVLTYHRHIYGLGEHYNSTQPLKEVTDSEVSD